MQIYIYIFLVYIGKSNRIDINVQMFIIVRNTTVNTLL